jgi:hypothetical protein
MWTDEQRGILTLTVRGESIKVDPMPFVRRYRNGQRRVGNAAFADGLKQMLSGEESLEVAALIFPVIKDTLGWPSFDEDKEKGYTQDEMMVAFTQFIEWLIDSKKKGENSPSSAGSDGASDATPAMASGAASSTTEMSSNPVVPGQPQSA